MSKARATRKLPDHWALRGTVSRCCCFAHAGGCVVCWNRRNDDEGVMTDGTDYNEANDEVMAGQVRWSQTIGWQDDQTSVRGFDVRECGGCLGGRARGRSGEKDHARSRHACR